MKLDYEQLYSQAGLNELHKCFLQFVKAKNSACNLSLIETAEYLEEFLSEQFGIQQALNTVYKCVSNHSLIAYAKRQFVQRHALKTFPHPQNEWQNLYIFTDMITFANAACEALEHSTSNLEHLSKYASWAVLTPQGQQKHKHDSLFHMPEKINPDFTLRNVKKVDHSYITTSPRNREGFDLTDAGFSNPHSVSEAHYCILCHNQKKDSCRSGLAQNPKKPGCPLDLKISQMHTLKRNELNIAALAVIMIDNPMVAATGHRICNDCMKACIFQKQDPVNIAQIESENLKDVLQLPYGFEIYSLLSRWNPLNLKQELQKIARKQKNIGESEERASISFESMFMEKELLLSLMTS